MSETRFNGYHFHDGDFVPLKGTRPSQIKMHQGWCFVLMDDGTVWQKTPKTGWEKMRDGNHIDNHD